jgi:hypothetical protein
VRRASPSSGELVEETGAGFGARCSIRDGMNRRTKWLLIAGVSLLVILINLVGFGILFLPGLVRVMAIGALEDLGMTDVDLTVAELTPSRARLENLTAGGGGRFRVKVVEAEYGLLGLASRRVDTIRISDLRIGLALAGGAIDPGPLAGLAAPGAGAGAAPSDPSLPFGILELTDAVISVDMGGGDLEIPFDVAVENVEGRDRPIGISGSGELPGGGRFEIEGGLSLGKDGPSGELKAVVRRFTIRDEDRNLLGDCVPAARGFRVGGDVALAALIEIEKGEIRPRIGIELADMSVRNEASKAAAKGIDVSTVVSSVKPLATEPGRRLSVSTASFGDFETRDVVAVFHVPKYPRVRVESLKCGWADGKLSADDADLDLSELRLDAVLLAEGLSLQKVIDFVYPGCVECEGKLYGRLPVSVHVGKGRRVEFGAGFLEARPSRGWVRIREEDAKRLLGIEKVVPLEQAGKEDVVKLLALQALQDMEYTQLKFEFGEEDGRGWVVHGRINGSGPRGGGNRIPIEGFRPNFYGLEDLLNLIINGARLMPEKREDAKAKEEEEAVNEAIDEFF